MPFTYRNVTVDGLTLRIGQMGGRSPSHAVPMLLLNGIDFNAELMEPLARAMTARPILCADMPGCGKSPDPKMPYTMSRIASVMTNLMHREYPDRRFDCLGFSWGGAVAQQIAVQSARSIERLALISTTSGLPLPFGNAEVMARLLDPVEYARPDKLSENFHAMLLEGGANAGLLRRFSTPTPMGVSCQVTALSGWSVAPLLPFLRVPVLLAHMAEDAIVPIAHQQALTCFIPQAENFEIASGGHLLPLAMPDKVAERLNAFFGPIRDHQTD